MITLLKLKDGTEVVGKALSDNKEGIVLSDPFVVFYKPSVHSAMPSVGLFRYMPFSNEQVMFFETSDIRHAVIPSKAFESYYLSCLETFKEQLDVEIDKELIEATTNSSLKSKEMQELYVALLERAENDGMLN